MTTKVLVVDDELDTLNLLKTLLEITGFEPITTLNSSDAITLAEIEEVDVALLDIMMPAPDGFELCRMMREHDMLKTLPIIFVTAYDALDLEDRKDAVGADHVVRKPIDIDMLTNVIEEIHSKKQIEAAAEKLQTIADAEKNTLSKTTESATAAKPVATSVKPTATQESKPTPPETAKKPEVRTASTDKKAEKPATSSTSTPAASTTTASPAKDTDKAAEQAKAESGVSKTADSATKPEAKTDKSESGDKAKKSGSDDDKPRPNMPIIPKRPPTPS